MEDADIDAILINDLRDHFAGQALQGVAHELKATHPPVQIAEWCYIMADAMLAARGGA